MIPFFLKKIKLRLWFLWSTGLAIFYKLILFKWLKSIIQYASILTSLVQINLMFGMG
ncbi:hypothetical protein EPIR_2264 [Erwinia piriflorinigrans CFBP 5888]|uniref:Uncharacterized protein n=1 Tax=Erwinia piriflorinigrans CFBP 5888 TaxID=1161919 RepID=V5Z8S5_9GAMM|nr:hypothetical protein EPIR_2264 [Erwinia piriflorinigrans CFBP 5888]